MEFAYCEGLSNAQPSMNTFKIKEATAVKKGDVLAFDGNNFIIKATESSYSIGVAAEDHPANDNGGIMPARNFIKVIDSPNAVYRAYGMKLNFKDKSTATRLFPVKYVGSTSTYAEAVLVLVSKAAGSENTDEIGSVRKVGSIKLENEETVINVSSGGIPHPDDVYVLLPAIGCTYVYGPEWGADFHLGDADGSMRCVGHDLSTNNANGVPSCFLKLRNHIANKISYQ